MPTHLLLMQPPLTLQLGGLKTLIRRNCMQLRRNATPLKTLLRQVRRVLSGGGGAADPHGRIGRSGVNSRRPHGSPRGIKFACVCPSAFRAFRQNGEASGLVPEVLHNDCCGRNWWLSLVGRNANRVWSSGTVSSRDTRVELDQPNLLVEVFAAVRSIDVWQFDCSVHLFILSKEDSESSTGHLTRG